MLESIINYFAGLEPGWLYVALFLSSYIENIFPPIPGDTVTVFAAYLVGRTNHSMIGVMAATTAGSSAGFMTYYILGRLVHPDYFVRRNFRFLPASGIERVGNWFRRFGSWVILFNRFFSSFRAVVSIVAGIFRLPWPRVFVLALISCAVWNSLLIYAGYMLGFNWALIENILAQYSRVLIAAAVLLVAGWFVYGRIARRRDTAARRRSDRRETE